MKTTKVRTEDEDNKFVTICLSALFVRLYLLVCFNVYLYVFCIPLSACPFVCVLAESFRGAT